ncbi:MAG: PEP-CTERM sorting domain-containing protein [Planctomycetota bacterium]
MVKTALTALSVPVIAGLLATPATAAILLTPINGGTEGASSDTTQVTIDAVGNPSVPGPDFQDYNATGSVADARAFDTTFDFTIDAAAVVDLTTGAKITDGLIDRAGSGDLGVRPGGGNGIEEGEGYILGIDATDLAGSAAWQLTSITFRFVGGGETYTVVNPATNASLSGTTSGVFDVSSLDLTVSGGTADLGFANVFLSDNGTGDNIRITGFEFAVVPEPASLALVSVGLACVSLRRRG